MANPSNNITRQNGHQATSSSIYRKNLNAGLPEADHDALGRTHRAGKNYNRALLLRLILRQGPISRLALSRLTKLSPAALTILTGQLLEEGRLIEAGEQENEEESVRAGRRSTLLDLNADSAIAIGVHIAPRAIRVGLVDLKGQIRARTRLGPPSEDASKALDEIAVAARRLLAESGLPSELVIGVGVGAVGLVQHEQGINLSALSLHWRDIPIRAELEQRLNLPVQVDNNARTMALAEYLFSRYEEQVSNLTLVYVGAGIGAGIVTEGRPYRGSAGAAGEIGHVMVVPDGLPCYCGARGCLETVASESGLVRHAEELALKGASPYLAQKTGGVNLEALMEAVQAGDGAATALVYQAGLYLGMVVGALAKVLNPETLVLAGPLLDARLPLLEQVQSVMAASSGTPEGSTLLRRSSLGEDIGIVGGAALVLYERVFSEQH
ncbi:MAG TPA: ROK family protein [Chloroflexia bacterium]|nr:ROK family protein [Chloroflexia bacterium]